MPTFIKRYLTLFIVPIIVLIGIIAYSILSLSTSSSNTSVGIFLIISVIIIGSLQLVRDTLESILSGSLALDYIAITAILLGVITGEYFTAAIVVLMLSGGNALERYAAVRARSSLDNLKERIPNILSVRSGDSIEQIDISDIKAGQVIVVRKGEVIGLDGTLKSDSATVDESSLTGEAYPVERLRNDIVRSGTVNTGNVIEIEVTKTAKESTYRKITDMISEAQNQKTTFIRLADRYNIIFTLITFTIAGVTFLATQDPLRILAVLVIATPCPLILATPIALIGGVNSAARRNIVIKNLAVLELVNQCKVLVLDKTGTITIGTPSLVKIKVAGGRSENEVLQIAAALERNSLHPYARSIVSLANERNLTHLGASEISEKISRGISGVVGGNIYTVIRSNDPAIASVLVLENDQQIGELVFEDVIKDNAREMLSELMKNGLDLQILSGDAQEKVDDLVSKIGLELTAQAGVTPEGKLVVIRNLQQTGKKVVMVGDGINDAPALAKADVGLVFSHEEYTAAAEAGDVIFLKNDLRSISQLINISRGTLNIAKQSIFIGIGLSITGMIFASFGLIVPIVGAVIQELIDIGVIFNSLRSSRI